MIDEELVIDYLKRLKTDLVAVMRSEKKYLNARGTSHLFGRIIEKIERMSVEKK